LPGGIGHIGLMTTVAEDLDRRKGADRRNHAYSVLAECVDAAIAQDEIEVLFQPQFAAAEGALLGAEALARWRHPAVGEIGGGELFSLAMRTGRVTEVSRHVARVALGTAARWPQGLHLSLNVTAADLASADFADAIATLLESTGFEPTRLTLEITEQSLVAELESPAQQLRQVARLGVHIALDDFGAGFCNFGYLKKLPLHALKLDRSMVEGIGDNRRDQAVLRGIVDMAQALGLEVIAEGVETEAQRKAVVREGCNAWQGFLGAQPMSAAEFGELVKG
jgi:EAL domain-containing protein (putative c-di-GMP-specific phosphodiesterase class I)